MRCYAHCSYRSAHSGYQYAVFDTEDTEEQQSILKTAEESSTRSDSQFLQFQRWNEEGSGWKLALLQNTVEQTGILMLGELEKSMSRKRAETQEPLDTDFYITIGFSGLISDLRMISASALKELAKDGGETLFRRFESAFFPSKDRRGYCIRPDIVEKVLQDLRKMANNLQKSDQVHGETSCRLRTILNRLIRIPHAPPQFNLTLVPSAENSGKKLLRSDRAENIRQCVNTILDPTIRFSEELLVLVAQRDSVFRTRAGSIRIDYEYLPRDGREI